MFIPVGTPTTEVGKAPVQMVVKCLEEVNNGAQRRSSQLFVHHLIEGEGRKGILLKKTGSVPTLSLDDMDYFDLMSRDSGPCTRERPDADRTIVRPRPPPVSVLARCEAQTRACHCHQGYSLGKMASSRNAKKKQRRQGSEHVCTLVTQANAIPPQPLGGIVCSRGVVNCPGKKGGPPHASACAKRSAEYTIKDKDSTHVRSPRPSLGAPSCAD